MVLKLSLGDQLHMRKAHPCGSYEWRVVRLGADIGLECNLCQRRVLLQRSYLERRIAQVTPAPLDRSPSEQEQS